MCCVLPTLAGRNVKRSWFEMRGSSRTAAPRDEADDEADSQSEKKTSRGEEEKHAAVRSKLSPCIGRRLVDVLPREAWMSCRSIAWTCTFQI
jgi:hypothetical protein